MGSIPFEAKVTPTKALEDATSIMPSKHPQNHSLMWTNLLTDLDLSSSSSWWQVANHLYNKQHGFSNYKKCLARDHSQVRQDVYLDERIKKYLVGDNEGENRRKIERILNEMCHMLSSQHNPSRRLKIAGVFFLKCITNVYSSIFVNNHIFPVSSSGLSGASLFKDQFLQLTHDFPVVILPTHRSYMDFLFISYIMTHYEMALPIVATGDNFKAMGKLITDYLKTTGAFLLRRTATRRTDVEAEFYYDILRAYVHSILRGGENPIEFFIEGTRTRVGQVLRPKTGLLSMVVDMLIDGIVDDIYILPVAINYQRPIEEQLLIGENTPQIDRKKPKESAENLMSAFNTIMKRQYGKVYVRFFGPFRLSEYFEEWKKVTRVLSIENGDRDAILHDFTNSLASKVCLEQANNNILMPYNLITCSLLAEVFLSPNMVEKDASTHSPPNGLAKNPSEHNEDFVRFPFSEMVKDFRLLEQLLQATQSNFVPGWNSHLDILEDFKLDRDGIVRATADRKFIEFHTDALTFQTMLYYSNQVIQVLLPVSICFIVSNPKETEATSGQWEDYKEVRTLLSKEFFANESFMEQEFKEAHRTLKANQNSIPVDTRKLITKHLLYFIRSYLKFLYHFRENEILDRDKLFNIRPCLPTKTLTESYLSKDMLKNMISLAEELGCVETTVKESSSNGAPNRRSDPERTTKIISRENLEKTIYRFERVESLAMNVIF